MATLGPTALPERSPEKRHYPEKQRSKAFRTMMDQQNLEAPQPASADPAVALAEMLDQVPKAEKPKPKTSVAELAEHHGLKLGDQNALTIRRIKRGKGYSFIRANGTKIRHEPTIRRLHKMAVPPAYRDGRYSADPNSHLQGVAT